MDDYDGADAIERAWRDGLKPDPLLTVSEWADRCRVLSQRASSEPGRWRTERTPYLREIMYCLSPSSPVQRVALMTLIEGALFGSFSASVRPFSYATGRGSLFRKASAQAGETSIKAFRSGPVTAPVLPRA